MNNPIQQLQGLLDAGESERIEFKSGTATPDVVGRNVCAFANAQGGTLLVGVDDSGSPSGIEHPESFVKTLRSKLTEALSPLLPVSITPIVIENKQIILVDVPQGPDRPYTWQKQIYVRQGHESVQADVDFIRSLISSPSRSQLRWERQQALGFDISDLDEDEIRATFYQARDGNLTKLTDFLQDPEAIVENLNLASSGAIYNSAVALFGKAPQTRFPQTRVRAIRYGDDQDQEISDNRLFEGHAFSLMEQMTDFLQKHVNIVSQIPTDSLRRKDQPAYPFAALREALLNAIQHRDYEAYDGGIAMIVRSYSIEIWNSGSLPPGMTVEDLTRPHHSRPQNPDIAHVFFLRGFVERVGSGTRRMLMLCREAGLPAPEWRADSGGVTVTFRQIDNHLDNLNDRQRQLVQQLLPGNTITTSEYIERFGISQRQARMDLADLVENGFLDKEGAGPTTRYVRTERS